MPNIESVEHGFTMVKNRTKASIIGMTAGVVIVTGLGLTAGIELFPALSLSLIGLAVGGWLAEREYEKRRATSSHDGTETV